MSTTYSNSDGLEKAAYKEAQTCDVHGPVIEKLEEENTYLRSDIEDLNEEIKKLKVSLAEAEETIEDLKGHLDDIDDSLAKAVKRLR